MSTNAIVYGDISPNVVDGSSIWLASITEVLAGIFDTVHLQLKMPPQNERIIGRLRNFKNIEIHVPVLSDGEVLSPAEAAGVVEKLAQVTKPSAVIARGLDVCNSFCQSGVIAPVLWAYATDLPFPPEKLSKKTINRLNRIAGRAHRLFAQTEPARSYLESIVSLAPGKTVLLNPMVPDYAFGAPEKTVPLDKSRTLRLVYAGKLAKDWKTLEMLQVPKALRDLGVSAELIVVGDKFNRASDDPHWIARMRSTLEEMDKDLDSGVTWAGGLSRTDSIEIIKKSDLGIGWRTNALNSTLEISTKALEYSAAGAVPLVNRNGDHQQLYGADYPFFADGDDTAEHLAQKIVEGLPIIDAARKQAFKVAQSYSMSRTRQRLEEIFSNAGSLELSPAGKKRKLLIVSHDLKFMGEILPRLERDPRFDIQRDNWDSLHIHDEKESKRVLQDADIIFCEFAGPSVVWHSKNKPDGAMLVVRLHGFEVRSNAPWLRDINLENVDHWIVVSDLYKEKVLESMPVQSDHVHVVPNTLDLADFDRPKLEHARFHIGLVGMVPFLKRPDRALDLLEKLLAEDNRYILHIKGRMPWDYPHEWKKPIQKQLYLEFFNRIAQDSQLKNSVVFDPFSSDIANWHRGIGFILSPSDLESFHLAPAEGMAARTIPLIWDREGAKDIFSSDYIYDSLDSLTDEILRLRDPILFRAEGESARNFASRWNVPKVYEEWMQIFSEPNF